MNNQQLWTTNLVLASGLAFGWLGIQTIEPVAALAPAAADWLPLLTALTVTLLGAAGWSMLVLRSIR
jgi:hypothetical protein